MRKSRFLQDSGGSLLKKACIGVIAGAIMALTAVPAMASEYEIRFEFPGRTVHEGSVTVYKVLSIDEELGDEKGVVTYGKGFENLFASYAEMDDFMNFINGNSSFNEETYQNYMNKVREKIAQGATGVQVNLAADPKKADVDGFGVYYVGNADSNTYRMTITGTNNRRGYVTSSAFFVSLREEDYDATTGSYARVSMPKPAVGDPSGGGGNPPGGPNGGPPTRSYTPPSEGSVLGASRDPLIPEVLGANRLPQTGQLWWPVPVLCIAGFALIGSGVRRRKTAAVTTH